MENDAFEGRRLYSKEIHFVGACCALPDHVIYKFSNMKSVSVLAQ